MYEQIVLHVYMQHYLLIFTSSYQKIVSVVFDEIWESVFKFLTALWTSQSFTQCKPSFFLETIVSNIYLQNLIKWKP